MTEPEPSANDPAVAERRRAERDQIRELLGGFHGDARPMRTRPGYLVGLGITAFAMALLPVLYFGLVAIAAYGIYSYVHDVWPMLGNLHYYKLRLLAYGAPPLAGVILVVFMVISAFPRRRLRSHPIPLDKAREPILFDFTHRLCAALGAPTPAEIAVDLEVNASAGPCSGFLDLLRRRLRLTLGLPLVEGLSAGGLASVIAHEFGHFTQRFAMLFQYVIRSVNGWFHRVVFEESSLDRQLRDASDGAGFGYAALLGLSKFFIWMSRRVLLVLLHLGHLISAYLSRQMEFDADRHAARIAGSARAANTMREIQALGIAETSAINELRELWNEGALAADLPRLIAAHDRSLRPALKSFIATSVASSRTSHFDTHPSIGDRLRALSTLDDPGIYRGEHPSRLLFADFRSLAAKATRWHYETRLGEIPRDVRWHDADTPGRLLVPVGVDTDRLHLPDRPSLAATPDGSTPESATN